MYLDHQHSHLGLNANLNASGNSIDSKGDVMDESDDTRRKDGNDFKIFEK